MNDAVVRLLSPSCCFPMASAMIARPVFAVVPAPGEDISTAGPFVPAPLADGGTGTAKNTKATRLNDRLREAILSGALPPGSKINLDTVRRAFDVSLSPLREALARLIAVGLVEMHDNRGYSVAPVSQANLAEITRLRAEFDSLALARAIAIGDLDWESEVMRTLHRLGRVARGAAWEQAHREFHMALLSGCGMPLLLQFCHVLHDLNDRYRRLLPTGDGGLRDVAAEHDEIARAAIAREAGLACAALREHVLRTGAALKSGLDGRLNP